MRPRPRPRPPVTRRALFARPGGAGVASRQDAQADDARPRAILAGPRRGVVVMVPAGLVIGVGGLVFNIVVGRLAGVAAYGAIGTLLLAGTIGSFSAQGVQYEMAASVSRGGPRWHLRPAALVGLVWPWLVVAAAGLASAGPLARFLHLSTPVPVVLAIGLFVATVMSALPQGMLVGGEWFVTIAAVGVTMTVARIGLGAWMAAVLPAVPAFLLASLLATAAGGAAFLIAAGACVHRAHRARVARQLDGDEVPPDPLLPTEVCGLTADQAVCHHVVAEPRGGRQGPCAVASGPALQGGALAVVMWVALSLPLLVARHLAVSGATGRFAAAQALAMGVVFVTAPITPAFYPSVARTGRMTTALAGLACTGVVAGAATAGMVILGPGVVRLFYGPSFSSSPLLFAALGVSASLVACLSYSLWACSALGRRRAVSTAILLAGAAEGLLATFWHSGPLALAIGPAVAVAGAGGLVGAITVAVSALGRRSDGRDRRHSRVPAAPPSAPGAPLGPVASTRGAVADVPLAVTVGIMAYNEQDSIEAVIAGYLAQRCGVTHLAEIVVIASGCTDSTVERAERAAGVSGRVRVLAQPTRDGKLAAVRSFLATAGTDVVVISGADTLPAPDLLEAMGARLVADLGVGMVGGRIVPTAGLVSFAQRLHEVLWALHHQVALRSPKLGEIVALRRSFVSVGDLSHGVSCDEVALEAAVIASGGTLAYEPSAVVGNRGPRALREYLYQRRRIRCQHLDARARLGYRPSTASTRLAATAVLAHLCRRPQDVVAVTGAVVVEALACVLARRDYRRGLDYRIWAPASSARPGQLEQAVALAAGEERQ